MFFRFLLLMVLSLAISHAAIAASDTDLQPVERSSIFVERLGAVGLITSEHGLAQSMATGFMVSPCHVLTAAHALAHVGEHVEIGKAVRFIPEGSKYEFFAEHSVAGRVVAASKDFVMKTLSGNFDIHFTSQDWSLIELEHPLPGIEPIKLLYPGAKLSGSALLSVAGYPAGGFGHLLHAQEHCLNWQMLHGAMELSGAIIADCAVRSGMSGGPMLIEGGNDPVAAGIVVERFEIGRKIMTVAVPTYAFADQVSTAMRSSKVCAVGSPFAAPPVPGNWPGSDINGAKPREKTN